MQLSRAPITLHAVFHVRPTLSILYIYVLSVSCHYLSLSLNTAHSYTEALSYTCTV